MFNGRGDEVLPSCLEGSRRPQNREIIRFCSTAGKNDFARFGAQKSGRAVARVVQQRPCFSPDAVNGGRVAPDFAQKRQHRFAHRRVERRGGVVIEINRGRHWQILIYDLRFAYDTQS